MPGSVEACDSADGLLCCLPPQLALPRPTSPRGALAVGLFATETSTLRVYGFANDWGLFYGGKGYQLGVQLLGIVCIVAWTTAIMLPLWLVLK